MDNYARFPFILSSFKTLSTFLYLSANKMIIGLTKFERKVLADMAPKMTKNFSVTHGVDMSQSLIDISAHLFSKLIILIAD